MDLPPAAQMEWPWMAMDSFMWRLCWGFRFATSREEWWLSLIRRKTLIQILFQSQELLLAARTINTYML
jgi:hypothetical protein